MSGKTKIEWATDQWNPVTGCSKVSQGCKHCYAEREWPRLAAPRDKANIYTGRDFTDVRCHPEKLNIPLHWTKPRRIFVNSMSDLFHDTVPDSFIREVWAVMWQRPQHIFQILTKRPERMRAWCRRVYSYHNGHPYISGMDGPAPIADRLILPNVWLGVSVEDQAAADERIPLLLQTPATVRWISAEPLLGHISFEGMFANHDPRDGTNTLEELDWVVVGGESGPKARPMHPDWVRSLRDQCQAVGVPFFFKQWGEWVPVCAQYPYTDIEHDETERAGCVGDIALEPDGVIPEGYQPRSNRTWLMDRVGKKAAGRMLDGREWNEYPAC